MFEKATRLKLRFNYRGVHTAEDLWDFQLKDLDQYFKLLILARRAIAGESLLKKDGGGNELLDLKIAIVRHVVQTRLKEQEASNSRAAKAALKQKLLGVIEQQQDKALHKTSIKDLQKMVDDLDV